MINIVCSCGIEVGVIGIILVRGSHLTYFLTLYRLSFIFPKRFSYLDANPTTLSSSESQQNYPSNKIIFLGESTEFKAHLGAVRSVEFSPENLRLVTASDDKSVKIWTVHRLVIVFFSGAPSCRNFLSKIVMNRIAIPSVSALHFRAFD